MAVKNQPTPRLCNEIQLFDLCEKEVCSYKSGRFCTEPNLLERFEKVEIKEARRVEPDDCEISMEDENEIYDDIDYDEDEYEDNDDDYDNEIFDNKNDELDF